MLLLFRCAPLALLCALSRGGNPLSPAVVGGGGLADPHVKVFPDARTGAPTFYLYSTHDFSVNDTGFRNDDWRVFVSADLVSWSLASTLLPNATPATPDEFHTCWATDAAVRNGSYYFYLSLGSEEIGVMRGATPAGPWEDPRGSPLVSKAVGPALQPPTESRDPCVFLDSDGAHYLVWGTFNYYIARLADDMVSLAEAPRFIFVTPNANSQNGVGILDDKPYMHRVGAVYILSFGCFYARGDSPYGPFAYVGTWIDLDKIAPDFRTNVSAPNASQWFRAEDYNDRHGSFFSALGQDYWSSNDRSHSADKKNTNAFRSSLLTYVHYRDDGSIEPVVIDATGVGEYRAAHVEAENFFRLSGAGARKGHDAATRFALRGLTAAAEAFFPHVRGVPARAALVVVASNGGAAPATVTASAGARVLCTAIVPPTGGWDAWAEARCDVAGDAPPEVDVWLTFAGGEGGREALRLDYFALVPRDD